VTGGGTTPAGPDGGRPDAAPDGPRSDVVARADRSNDLPPFTGEACPPGALLCEGFEAHTAGAAPGAPWRTLLRNGATATVSDARAYGGSKAIRFSGPAGRLATAQIIAAAPVLPPPTTNVVFGRAMMYLLPVVPRQVGWWPIQGSTLAGKPMYRLGNQTAGVMGASYLSAQNVGCGPPLGAKVWPTGRWMCVEWLFDGVNNQMKLWLDGASTPLVATKPFGSVGGGQCAHGAVDPSTVEWVAPRFEKLALGWENYQVTSAPSELWMDDIVIDTKRAGCPPPR
jgi:hypothetical protein